MKKRSLYIVGMLVVVMALVFSFASIATAKYAGAFYNGGVSGLPGYLSWQGANAIWNKYTDQTDPTATQTGAHGGYTTTTTKCAVCHAAHRAYAASASVGGVAPTNLSLTAGGTCVNCHTVWGAGGSDVKIEWAQSGAGPHNNQACTGSCHTGGIHGGSNSAYHGMNVYMLGADKDAALTDAFARGNSNAQITYGGTGTTGASWFQNGTTSPPSDMQPPSGVKADQFSAAKAMATGYTCAQDGCHTSGQFATNVWGFASMRAGDPTQPSVMDTPMTGHLTTFPSPYNTDFGLEYPSCGPCHPGAPAGGYRAVDSADFDPANGSARAYGCDQCHDMVGKATNTTAWPHGNRNIAVWEWDTNGDIIDPGSTLQASKNLWMYQANLMVQAQGNVGENTTPHPKDGSFKVINNAVVDSGTIGNINDGTCLKCHMALDEASIAGMGIDPTTGATIAADHDHALYVDGNGNTIVYQTGQVFVPSSTMDYTGTSFQIFLWK